MARTIATVCNRPGSQIRNKTKGPNRNPKKKIHQCPGESTATVEYNTPEWIVLRGLRVMGEVEKDEKITYRWFSPWTIDSWKRWATGRSLLPINRAAIMMKTLELSPRGKCFQAQMNFQVFSLFHSICIFSLLSAFKLACDTSCRDEWDALVPVAIIYESTCLNCIIRSHLAWIEVADASKMEVQWSWTPKQWIINCRRTGQTM